MSKALFFLPCVALSVACALVIGDGRVSRTVLFAFYLGLSLWAFTSAARDEDDRG